MKDFLNINEVAKELGVSIPTIRLKLERKVFPNAHQVKQGKRKVWRIPSSDLIASGLLDKVKANEQVMADNRTNALEQRIDALDLELRLTRELLEAARTELATYRPIVLNVLETRAAQEKRRSLWRRLTNP